MTETVYIVLGVLIWLAVINPDPKPSDPAIEHAIESLLYDDPALEESKNDEDTISDPADYDWH